MRYNREKKELTFDEAKDKALRLLEFRSHSERELSDKLKRAGAKEEDIDEILEFCRNYGFLDDRKYAIAKAKDLKNLSELNDENRSLKSRLYQKDIDQSKLNRLESENRELKDLMSIKNSVSGSKQVVSDIIDRNYGSWDQEFVIDKGSSDGISDSMFVLSSGGVIGVVESIEKHSSKVKLLVEDTISSQHLTFKIESQGQSIFALLNGYDEKTGEFRLLQIGDPVEIKKGSLVSTSGLGKYKSSDLPLGTVTSTQKASDQLGQEIRVKPKANLDVNRYVLLIGE